MTVTDSAGREQREPLNSPCSGSLFMFGVRVGSVHLLIDALSVSAVCALEPVTRIPNAPPHIVGLLPYGEGALAIVDLAQFLHLDEVRPERYSIDMSSYRVVIVSQSGMEAGLLCDQALGVLSIERSRLEASNVLKGGRLSEFIREEIDRDEARFGVLDLRHLLDSAKIGTERNN